MASVHPFDEMTEPELRNLFNNVARNVRADLPPDTGFIVLAAPFGKDGVAQYVSNVHRDDAAKWMRETLERWERNDFVPR